jgi:hypothetical protein
MRAALNGGHNSQCPRYPTPTPLCCPSVGAPARCLWLARVPPVPPARPMLPPLCPQHPDPDARASHRIRLRRRVHLTFPHTHTHTLSLFQSTLFLRPSWHANALRGTYNNFIHVMLPMFLPPSSLTHPSPLYSLFVPSLPVATAASVSQWSSGAESPTAPTHPIVAPPPSRQSGGRSRPLFVAI